MKGVIIYYSNSGNTRELAKGIGDFFECEMFELVPDEEYGPYLKALKRASKERKEDIVPSYTAPSIDFEDVDTVFVGYPIWFSDVPRIMLDYLSKISLKGKRVIPFSTSGTTDISKTLDSLEIAAFGSRICFPLNYSRIKKNDFAKWVLDIKNDDFKAKE